MIRRIVDHAIIAVSILVVGFVIASAILYWIPTSTAMAQETMPTQTKAEPCVLINTFGTIQIARCEDPDTLQVYQINNMGFMLPIE